MRRKGQLSPSSTRSLSLKAKKNLLRMPSHPVFDTGVQRLSPQIPKFTPTSSLGFINFNRPPSQLSIYDTKLDEDFLVPVKGLDSLPTHDLFASGLAMASTPFKTQGLFELEQSSPGAGASIVETYSIQQGADKLKTLTVSSPGSHSHPEEPVEETAAKEPENLEDLTESMSLTSVEDGEQCHHDLTERSSWITDSLISPPTIYLKGPRARPSFSCGSIFSDSRSGTNGTDSVNQTSSKGESGPFASVGQPPNKILELSSTREDREEVLPATPEAEGSKPLADNPPTRAPGSIARTRRGTVTQVPSAPPSIRRPRSGTITQDAHPVPSEILDPESGGARITRARSNTIRPAATTTTATGTLIGLQKATSPTLDDLAVFPTFAPDPEENSHGADEALGCSVHVDAEFDPEPVEVLVFASAPNPDVEDDIDDEPTLSAVQQASRSSDVDPLNLGYEPQPPLDIAQDDSPDDEAVGTSKPTSKRRNLRWAPGSMTTRKGKGKQQQQKQSGAKPKSAPKGLKKALGLLAKRDNSDSYDRSRSPSTDPIDFLSHLDDSEDHGDARVARARDDDGDVTGEKQAERPPKKKSLSVRWEDVVGAMG
ncbi:hypothetical protein CC1G_05233 [Coprinopsis cinerea okayama7|uniref:Uncharacterized protein n=1 Tax=Coprinopsis cinerea (strain Okayama-7 / 130 / ATCC MYA-4618 / FGSC 9003) TaxID=240176 RepID=A8PC96_COPC7|nr:hypothetical protein CC1G_05233 [Coprinopsis cinerea okayama7\|eukprot:XP_001840347.2 hypothetical protein CC1G_05233 [Coprinopsis cinerea okayama7\